MGLTALISIPLYTTLFGVVANLVQSLSGSPGGYETFNLSRYGLSLFVMLPSTVLAGMTLPLITGAWPASLREIWRRRSPILSGPSP